MKLYLAGNRDGQTLQIAYAAMGDPVKLYLADTNATHLHNGFLGARRPFPLLLSYFYFRDRNMVEVLDKIFQTHVGIDLFADSGAFSAHSLGQPLRVEDYRIPGDRGTRSQKQSTQRAVHRSARNRTILLLCVTISYSSAAAWTVI